MSSLPGLNQLITFKVIKLIKIYPGRLSPRKYKLIICLTYEFYTLYEQNPYIQSAQMNEF